MQKNQIIVIIVAAVLVVAGIGVYLLATGEDAEKKGLYKLNAVVTEVNMGQCSATPGVIVTLEDMYEAYYGDLVDDTLTIDDAKADTDFWSTYGTWDSLISDNGDGTLDVTVSTSAKGDETVTMSVCDTAVVMGTMYSETMYFLACAENDVEVYSEESYTNAGVKEFLSNAITGGMIYSYFEDYDVEYMLKCVSESDYFDLGVTSVQKVEPETLASALEDAMSDGNNAVYFASGTRMTADYYDNNVNPCKSTGANYAFFGPTTISDVFSCVEAIGCIMGFDDETIDEVIEDIQLRLYKIYYSVESKTSGTTDTTYAYWESGLGSTVKSSMAKVIVQYLGFDASLLDGADHDLESLLEDNPKLLIFYTNDSRTMDEMMRVDQ